MSMYYVFTLDSVFKSVLPKGSEPSWQTNMLYIVLLIYVNETIYLFGKSDFLQGSCHFMALNDPPGANVISLHVVGEGPGASLLSFETFPFSN